MLSQFSWLQFFLFVGGAALLWYVYVLFVYFGSSINRAITQPREQATIAIPVARRPVSRSIIQTEDFSIVASPATTNQPFEQEPAAAPALKGEREGASETEKEVATSVSATTSAPAPPSVLVNTPPAVNKDAAELLAALDSDDDIVTTEASSDMSPAVLAALSGQSYNWADSPALNMDYREPDDKGVEEIIATPVTEETDTEETDTSENTSDTAGVPADDYATTIAQLIKPEIEPEAKETVFASLQNLTGNTSVANLVQRSKNVAGNLSIAFEELQNRGQLSEAQVEFRERFLKPVAATAPTAPVAATAITENTDSNEISDKDDKGSSDNSSAPIAVPATPPMDGEDYQALLDSMKV